jgi:hypothetical protein
VAVLLASYGYETVVRARWRGQFGSPAVHSIASWHDARTSKTDDWLAQIGFDLPACGKMKISYQEVEAALNFDDRVNMVSSDGRVWPIGVSGLFRQDGSVDAARWIQTLRPNVLVELPPDAEIYRTFDGCKEHHAPTCRFADVEWARVETLNAWVDTRCVRRRPPL